MDVESIKMLKYTQTPTPTIKNQEASTSTANIYEANNILYKVAENKETDTKKLKYTEEDKKDYIEKAIEDANKILHTTSRRLSYSRHEKTNRIIVSVINTETKEVIREIPPEKLLDAYAKMLELAGLLVDKKS